VPRGDYARLRDEHSYTFTIIFLGDEDLRRLGAGLRYRRYLAGTFEWLWRIWWVEGAKRQGYPPQLPSASEREGSTFTKYIYYHNGGLSTIRLIF